ncbi:DNA sulfur modification protein DndB [Nocardia suismassiliense]|uniref:DNA sulfur modification protein DndB n=1 Tax=Nocardia suismassiliense TaxID=2077092 RepID=UPI00131F3AE0|nr:DNA sulfur modification protein DndB [Nocardia suismassiliense]
MTLDAGPDSSGIDELRKLAGTKLRPARFTATGQSFQMGEMTGIVTALPIVAVVSLNVDEVMTRSDYELEGIEPGNRVISLDHVKKIKKGLRKHANKLLTGTFTLAIAKEGVDVELLAPISDGIDIVKFSVLAGHRVVIVDAQHRNLAVRELWDETMDAVRQGVLGADEIAEFLRASAIPVLILLEGDKDEISRMFVTMASTKPISPSLIAVMDREQFANRIGLEVARRWKLLSRANRLAFQSSTATGDTVYSAAAVRGAVANLFIGYKDRTPDMREENLRRHFGVVENPENENLELEEQHAVEHAADEALDYLDYAFARLPGWKDIASGTDPKEFRAQFVHGTPAGLYVVAGVICAARMSSGVDPKYVIDLMAKHVKWRRDARVIEDEKTKVPTHPDFEGTLVVTEGVVNETGDVVGWRTRTGGGARTNYEKAARSVIDRLIKVDPELSVLRSDQVQIDMGLKAGGKRGRPRKA